MTANLERFPNNSGAGLDTRVPDSRTGLIMGELSSMS